MLYREISKILGYYLLCFTGILLIPFFLAGYYEYFANASHPQPHSTWAFFYTILVSLSLAGLFTGLGRKTRPSLYRREGLILVVVIWVITPLISALPFLLSGTLERFDQALFEMVSGYTTTGSSILNAKKYDSKTGQEIPFKFSYAGLIPTTYEFYGNVNPIRDPITHEIIHEGVEAVSKALLLWRSLVQWIGGGGIIILFVALLPALGVGGKMLFQTETPGPIKSALTPRIKETAIHLWKIYISLTLLQVILLIVTNQEMPLFDAITIAFSTLSTGGFSVRNDSIGAYHSAATDVVVIVFMILGSINFALYYYALKGKFYRIYEPEFLTFMAILFVVSAFTVWNLVGVTEVPLSRSSTESSYSISEALRYGVFQIISSQTSTGFITANYNHWPAVVQTLMLIVMYLGGMSGSTAGGIKIVRHYMLFRIVQNKVELLFRPETVRKFRIGNTEVDVSTTLTVLCFFVVIASISVLATFLYVWDGIDPESALGLSASSINNVGVGFRIGGAGNSLAFMSPFSTYLSILWMLLGRLEFFAVLVLLVPAFWRDVK